MRVARQNDTIYLKIQAAVYRIIFESILTGTYRDSADRGKIILSWQTSHHKILPVDESYSQ